jgi:hypothetical protein
MPRKLKLRQRGRIVANNSTTNAMSTRTRTPQPPTSSSSTKGAAKAAKSLSDEALFFVDKSAARTAVPTAAAKGKRKRGDDNDVDVNDNDVDVNAAEHKPLRAVHLARERVLGIDAALAYDHVFARDFEFIY